MARSVIIIGAGPGGLAAALLLAHAGLRVVIVERRPTVGGRTSCIEEAGFRFDVGPTFFLYPRVLSEIFREIGRDLNNEIPMRRIDPLYRLIFGSGGHLDATRDVERMESAIAALSPRDARSFRRFLDDNRLKLEKFRPCLENPFLSWRDLFRRRLLTVLPWLKPGRALDTELKRYFSDPRLRIAFSFQSKYLGMSPYRCPSLFTILPFLEYEYGVHHPIGGCSALTGRMAEIAMEMGVDISCKEPVTRILFQGRRAIGVETTQGRRFADALVVNADFAHAMTNFVPDRLRKRWTNHRIARKKFSCSAFMMYLGIEGRIEHLPHHTIYIAADYQKNLDDIERNHVLSDDPSLYIQNACSSDTTLAPPGMSTLYVLVPVSYQHPNIDWSRERDGYRARILQQLAKLGLSDVQQRIRFERIVTPQDWETKFGIYRGAVFNLAHNLRQMLHFRPRNRFEDLERVYLVGGGTHPGSGLPVIFESARITARLLLQDLNVPLSPPAPADPVVSTSSDPRNNPSL